MRSRLRGETRGGGRGCVGPCGDPGGAESARGDFGVCGSEHVTEAAALRGAESRSGECTDGTEQREAPSRLSGSGGGAGGGQWAQVRSRTAEAHRDCATGSGRPRNNRGGRNGIEVAALGGAVG
ncbi:hypothetical protein NDU88_001026 [Pleurodeles waltl]|uniref:Uncharacterized protein n=1 Tax=Pleurodeles waltl TaxID=8319 RepID=A0AAV7LXD5_PLEWA|nr:hypothetical protein NDU88_001026 [Pleurodeles waltl]